MQKRPTTISGQKRERLENEGELAVLGEGQGAHTRPDQPPPEDARELKVFPVRPRRNSMKAIISNVMDEQKEDEYLRGIFNNLKEEGDLELRFYLHGPAEEMFKAWKTEYLNKRKEVFLQAWGACLQRVRDAQASSAKQRNTQGVAQSTRPNRMLAKLAWVLDKLNSKRVCVALLVARDNCHVYANTIDQQGLKADLQLILQAVEEGPEGDTRKVLLKRINGAQNAAAARFGGAPSEQILTNAGRRLDKVITFLQANPAIAARIKNVEIHEQETLSKHAELRGADAVLLGLIDAMHAPGAAGDEAAPAAIKGDVGISKLCCGKCHMALQALKNAYGVEFAVLGTHLTTYTKTDADTKPPSWPLPHFLWDGKRSDAALKEFLGDKAYEIYRVFPNSAKQWIEKELLPVKSRNTSEPFSSGDEQEESSKRSKVSAPGLPAQSASGDEQGEEGLDD